MIEADQAFNRYRAGRRPEDLARVFDVCAPQLLLLANHVAGDAGVAEDLVQLTFLRAIEGVDRFEPGRPVQPWLVGILLREAKKHRRQASRAPDSDRLSAHAGERVPVEAAQLREFEVALAAALDELPQAYREVVGLRLIHGLTPTEIAHVRGVSPQTIKTQLRRGTERLRQLLPASFASALIPLATTASLLAASRKVILSAAGAATASSAAGAAAVTTAIATPAALVEAAAVGSLTRSVVARRLTWAVGAGAAVALGVVAFDAFDVEPSLAPAEHRVVVPPPAPDPTPIRASVEQRPATTAREVDRPLASFTGRVVGENHLGIPDLQIEILRLHADALITDAARLPQQTSRPRILAGSTRTDQLGRFTIGGVAPSGTFVLVLDAGGPRVDLRVIDQTPEPREQIELGELILGPPHLVHGRLVDPRGKPVIGARLRTAATPWQAYRGLGLAGPALEQVCTDEFDPDGALVLRCNPRVSVLTIPQWFRELYARCLGRTVTTDHEGRFTWVTPHRGATTLAVTAAGFAPRRIGVEVRLDEVDLGNFELHRLDGVSGLLVDEHGDPAPAAEVMLCHFDPDAACTPARPAAVTGADGGFHASWDHRRPMQVFARRAQDHPWQDLGVRSPERRIRITLPRRFEVVLRIEGRRASAHAAVPSHPELCLIPGTLDPGCPLGTLTLYQLGFIEALDLRGRRHDHKPGEVELAAIPPGDWILMVSAVGQQTRVVPLRVDGNMQPPAIELDPLEPTRVALADASEGRLQDLPVFGRGVDAGADAFEFPVLLGRTDPEGVLDLLGDRWRPRSIGTGSDELGFGSSLAGSGVDQVAITIPRRGVIEGWLTEHGLPAESGSWQMLARPSVEPDAPPATVPRSVVMCPVGHDGRFRFPALDPGRWDISAVRPRGGIDHPSLLLPLLFPDAWVEPQLRGLVLQARGHQKILLEAMPPAEPPAAAREDPTPTTVHGTVRTSRPVFGALQVGVEVGGRWSWSTTDRDGRFDTGVTPGAPGAQEAPWTPGAPVRVAVLAADTETVATGTPEQYLWLASVGFVAGRAPVLDLDIPVHLMAFTMTTPLRRDHAEGLEVVLEGALHLGPGHPGTAPRCRLRARTNHGGWFRIDMPAGDYMIRTEHEVHGWLAQQLRVEFPHSRSYRLSPLLVAGGYALTTAIGVELPTGSKVRFVRVDGGLVPLTRWGTFAPRVGILGRPPRPFEVKGLLPGRYRVSVHPSRIVSGRVVAPERVKISVAQGTVEIGPRGREGVVLQMPDPNR